MSIFSLRHVLGLKQGIDKEKISESALTYPFAEPKEQISGSTNEYKSKHPGGDNVTVVASTYGKGAIMRQKMASRVVAH